MQLTNDQDYLGARLHGRRSRMAEGDRLDQLCRLSSVEDLVSALELGPSVRTAAELQQHLERRLLREVWELSEACSGPKKRYLRWELERYRLANLKVLVRAFEAGRSLADVQHHLVWLPPAWSLDLSRLRDPGELGALAELLSDHCFGEALAESIKRRTGGSRTFSIEADLDRAYLTELLASANSLRSSDAEAIDDLLRHQVLVFLVMVVLRGRFSFDLPSEELVSLHMQGSLLSKQRYGQMLAAQDPASAMALAPQSACRYVPSGPTRTSGPDRARWLGTVEALASSRYLQLANRAFRRHPVGFPSLVGFLAARRIEVANLATLSEGLRLGVPADRLRKRLIPRTDQEVWYA